MTKQKVENKDTTFWDKLLKVLEDNIKIMLLTLISGGYVGYKEYTAGDKEIALKNEVVSVLKTDLKEHLDSARNNNFNANMQKALMDPKVWSAILSSGFISKFTTDEKRVLREEFNKKIAEVDSTSKAQVNMIGRVGGFRNDEFELILGRMMKDYIRKNETRIVEVPTM
jgi:hypothetical protein